MIMRALIFLYILKMCQKVLFTCETYCVCRPLTMPSVASAQQTSR